MERLHDYRRLLGKSLEALHPMSAGLLFVVCTFLIHKGFVVKTYHNSDEFI